MEDRLVAIVGKKDRPVGAGLLIDDDLVLTCAHVVNAALGHELAAKARPTEVVCVRLHGAAEPLDAHVDDSDDAWRPMPASKDGGDLCVLHFDKKAAVDRGLALMHQYAVMYRHRFRALGYPAEWGELDVAEGRILARSDDGLYMITSEPRTDAPPSLIGGENRPDGAIYRGFSGGPVESENEIVGLVNSARGPSGATAYMTPVSAFPKRFASRAKIDENRVSQEYGHVDTLHQEMDKRLQTHRMPVDLRVRDCANFAAVLDVHRAKEASDDYGQSDLTPVQVARALRTKKKVALLHAPGGGGKSTVLYELLLAAPDAGLVPFFLDFSRHRPGGDLSLMTAEERLKRWFEQQWGDAKDLFELGKQTRDGMRALLVIDGVNQAKIKPEDVLETIAGLSRGPLSAAVIIISDRMTYRGEAMEGFEHAVIPPIARVSYAAALTEPWQKAIAGEASWLPILTSPIFLNLLLKFPKCDEDVAPTRFQLLNSHFTDACGLKKDDLGALSDFAFDAYRKNRRTAIPKHDYEKQLPEPLRERIRKHALIHDIDAEAVEFRHQLLHDALAALKVASVRENEEEELLRGPAFDVLSLDAASGDPIELAAEALLNPELLLGERERRPEPRQFLDEVFDWNYWITFQCVASFDRLGRSPLPEWVRHVIYGMNIERVFDPFLHTVERAERLVTLIPADADLTYLGRKSRPDMAEDIARHVRESSVSEADREYVDRWLKVYIRSKPFTFEDLDVLWADPIIAWTAANVLRRFDHSDGVTHELTRLYEISRATSDSAPRAASFRWRLVHALGRVTSEYPTLVRATFDRLENVNVRYGAARSLVEVAALRADSGRRNEVLETLKSRLPELFERSEVARIRKELRRSCALNEDFTDARPGWREEWLHDGLRKYAAILRVGQKCAKLPDEAELWKRWADVAENVSTDVGKWPERDEAWRNIIRTER